MHGNHSASLHTKVTLSAVHLCVVVWAGWLLSGGFEIVLTPLGFNGAEATIERRTLLFAAALIYWARMSFGLFALMNRRVAFSEVAIVAPWLFVIHSTFALLGAGNPAPVGVAVWIGVALYLVGSVLNSCAEISRRRWKRQPAHAGHLYTEGVFKYTRHPNYFGDVVLFSGYALVTGRLAALSIPLIMALGFAFEHAPKLDAYLEQRYGEEYRRWAARTPRLFPRLF